MKSKKIIIITVPYNQIGGVSVFVENIIPHLNYQVIKFKRGARPEIKSNLIKYLEAIWNPIKLFYIICTNRPPVILVNSSLSKMSLLRDGALISVAKLLRVKVVLYIHGFKEPDLKYKALLNFGYFKADRIIVLAKEFSTKLKEHGYKRKIETSFNPISEEFITDKPKKNLKLISNFLFLSRIEEEKGILIAIDAFKLVQNDYPNITLVIAGTGNALEKAKNYVFSNKINNVKFEGFVIGQKKIDLYHECDLFLFPTYYGEGLPINILEAMASCQIIVTRPVAGLIDLKSKINFGYSIPKTDYKDFAKRIIKIIDNQNDFEEIRRENGVFAKNNFAPQIIGHNLSSIIDEYL